MTPSPETIAPAEPATASRPYRLLSAELLLLAERFETRPATLGEVIEVVHGRGYNLVLILLCLPFLTPIPLPLLSTVFGAAIAFIGFRLMLGQKPRLPRRLLEKPLPPKWFPKLLRASSRIVRALEWGLKPRLRFFHTHVVFRRLGAGLIMLCGMKLLLPLPVPMSNFFPAATILLLAASALEEDGLVFLLGLLMFAASATFFSLLAFGGASALQQIWTRVFA